MNTATHLNASPQRVLVIGAGRGGVALLELFWGDPLIEIVGVMDSNPQAPGMALAEQRGIPCYTDLERAITACRPCIAFNLTGDERVSTLAQIRLGSANVIGGFVAHFLWGLLTRLKVSNERIAHQAYHDALTDLPNRALFYDRLEQTLARSRRTGERFAVLYLDLDGFKTVNDTFGHDAGDAVLRMAAQRMTSCVRASDTVARLGGDEFAFLLHGVKAPDDLHRVARALIAELRKPFDYQGQILQISASIGIALMSDQGATADALIKSADESMYTVKQSGRDGYLIA
jgi:diguanylate cyclase (GGDEF)-like protein